MGDTEKKVRAKKKLRKVDILVYTLVAVLMIAGLSFLAYPTFSDWWNTRAQRAHIAEYTHKVEEIDPTALEAYRQAAIAYNEALARDDSRYTPSEEELAEYMKLLDVAGSGVMGSIKIPKIGVDMPIYHTSEEVVIQVACGHIVGTSLPVGGVGSHCVLSSHRGLPSAKLFTDLDKVEVGDKFMLSVLNEVLTYQVDQILTVLPHEMDALAIDEEGDYCTLVTCTPYGVNTHRLLVRGVRVPTEIEEEEPTEVLPIPPIVEEPSFIPVVGSVVGLSIVLTFIIIRHRRRAK